MSYAITCYHSDSTISNTEIYVYTIGLTYNLPYTESSGDDIADTRTGFAYSAKFTATPASGSAFKRWVYRVGSIDADVQYSTANPFTYTEGEDIWIRAEGESDSSGGSDDGGDGSIGEWTIKASSIGRLSGTYSKYYAMGAFNYTMYRIAVIFTQSGTAKFYAETGKNGEYLDSYGYLSTTTEYILVEKGGRRVPTPVDILIEDDDSGETATSFQFSYNVEAGVTYYLWVRGVFGSDTEHATIYIEAPSSETVEYWDWEIGTGSAKDRAYQAITSNGYVDDFSYSVWNELVEKVLEVIKADPNESVWFTESNNGTAYLPADETKMKSSDKVMTAERFNALKFNIGSRGSAPSTGIADKSAGQEVVGDYFVTLAKCINGWIDNL